MVKISNLLHQKNILMLKLDFLKYPFIHFFERFLK